MKLQVNTAGAWKDVVSFEKHRRDEVIAAVRILADALGSGAKWCLMNDTGEREWLRVP